MLSLDAVLSRRTLCALCLLLARVCSAQSDAPLLVSEIDLNQAKQQQRTPQPRELTVLTETLSADQLDRAVLNRLMHEIVTEAEQTKLRLELSDRQLQELFIILSNARGFINDSEMANVRAMCKAWNDSAANGDIRIGEALAAYRDREHSTKRFIARYYAVVVADIESQLEEKSLPLFRAYMDDRRRRLANAGMTSWGSPVQNIRAGTDTIEFHCR